MRKIFLVYLILVSCASQKGADEAIAILATLKIPFTRILSNGEVFRLNPFALVAENKCKLILKKDQRKFINQLGFEDQKFISNAIYLSETITGFKKIPFQVCSIDKFKGYFLFDYQSVNNIWDKILDLIGRIGP